MHLSDLPLHHRDPFDRILVCQTIQHDLEIVTVDSIFALYPCKRLALPQHYARSFNSVLPVWRAQFDRRLF